MELLQLEETPVKEEANAEEGTKSVSLADQLWFPWGLIAQNPVPTFVAYIILNGVYLIIWSILNWIAELITRPGLFLVLLFGFICLLRQVALVLAYPGHLQLVVRDGEQAFAKITKRRLLMFIEAANEVVEILLSPNAFLMRRLLFVQAYEKFSFAFETMLVPLRDSLEFSKREQPLNAHSTTLLTILNELVDFHTKKFQIACEELISGPIKTFEERRLGSFHGFGNTNSSSKKDYNQLVPTLLTTIDRLQEMMHFLGAPLVETPKDMSWMIKESFQRSKAKENITNLNLMRADLAVRFKGEQVWIKGYNNLPIDGMFLPAKGKTASIEKNHEKAVIFCNPNGGLYELHHFQSDWFKFYTELGCNVFAFNYRGYGRNKGIPSPHANNYDALAIVEYLKTERGITKIAVHGESIGGLVATFLANHSSDIHVLIADRTFASLPSIAQRLVAPWAGTALKWLTRWKTDNVANYLNATCYKILCSDPCDEIIVDGASLKSGVALNIAVDDKNFDLPQDLNKEPHKLCAIKTSRAALSAMQRRILEEEFPRVGIPLTEEMIFRFSNAVISVAKRAKQSSKRRGDKAITAVKDVELSVSTDPEEEEDIENNAEGLVAFLSSKTSLSDQLVMEIWMLIACMDGFCGQSLLQAAEGGYEKIRTWTASTIVWGSSLSEEQRQKSTVQNFERMGMTIVPISLDKVHTTLQSLMIQFPALRSDWDVAYIAEMIQYIRETLAQNWAKPSTPGASPMNSERMEMLGHLIPLNCGHNRNFSDEEKQILIGLLKRVGFLDS